MELSQQAAVDFADPDLLSGLEALDANGLDQLTFGVIRMNKAGIVIAYNAFESATSGLPPGNVVGRNFFETVGLCMNNSMVAGRFEAEPALDATIDYVLTFHMRSTPARLRLLQSPFFRYSYLLIEPT